MTQKSIKIWDFLLRKRNAIDIQDSQTYKRVTIKIKRNGISLRDSVIGTEIWTKKQFSIKQGQFLISKIDARNGAFGIVPQEVDWGIITWNFWTFDIDEKIVDRDYFLSFISTNAFDEICEKTSSGTTNRKYLDEKKFLKFEIHIPETIEEQRKIVENYFKAQNQFIELKNLSEKSEKLIKSLKSSILQDAIQWKLVPQDPTDEPASILIEKIQVEKIKLIAEWKLKKQKPLAPIKPEEIPYELPKGWEWLRLEYLLPDYQNWVSSRGDSHWSLITVLRLADIRNQEISFSNTREIVISDKDIVKYWIKEFDILITRVNWSADIVWQFTLSEKSIDAIYCDHFIRLRINNSWIIPKYLILVSKSSMNRRRISELFITTAGQKTVNQQHINSLLIPLPPLQEQKRIIEKIDELMKSCELLDEQVKQAKERSENLMESVLQGVFNW